MKTGVADLYVSGWYILGALIFTLFAYPVGNLVPELIPGSMGAAFSGLWIHDAIGLYVTPLAIAMAYYIFPAATGRPIYSHFWSMVGFWLLFLVYPLNGTHHFVGAEANAGAPNLIPELPPKVNVATANSIPIWQNSVSRKLCQLSWNWRTRRRRRGHSFESGAC